MPSMRPAPFAAGFQFCFPGRTARAGNSAFCAAPRRDMLNVMPVAVTHFTNSRRDGRISAPLDQRSHQSVAWKEGTQLPPIRRTDTFEANRIETFLTCPGHFS